MDIERIKSMNLGISSYLRIPRIFVRVFKLDKKQAWDCELQEARGGIKIIYTLINGKNKK